VSTPAQRVLAWLRAGYPAGIPAGDYIALFGILHRQLTEAEIDQIVAGLAAQADPTDPVTAEQISAMVSRHVRQDADPEAVARVRAHLAEGGWPLAPLSALD